MPLVKNDYETFISCARKASEETERITRMVMDTVIEGMANLDHDLATEILQGLREISQSNHMAAVYLQPLKEILDSKATPVGPQPGD